MAKVQMVMQRKMEGSILQKYSDSHPKKMMIQTRRIRLVTSWALCKK